MPSELRSRITEMVFLSCRTRIRQTSGGRLGSHEPKRVWRHLLLHFPATKEFHSCSLITADYIFQASVRHTHSTLHEHSPQQSSQRWRLQTHANVCRQATIMLKRKLASSKPISPSLHQPKTITWFSYSTPSYPESCSTRYEKLLLSSQSVQDTPSPSRPRRVMRLTTGMGSHTLSPDRSSYA